MVEWPGRKFADAVTLMKNIDYRIGSSEVEHSPLAVFSDEVCAFLQDLSQTILRDSEARRYPDVIAVGFWCRNGNIQTKKKEFGEVAGRCGRGLAFHITPGNIPVNFFFSYLFSLLAGNANIVRLPSRPFPQIGILLRILAQCLEKAPEIAHRTAFVAYPSADDEITEAFCAKADVRVIWGGDNTVKKIRQMPAMPRCVDITFANRFSIAILDSQKMAEASDKEISQLAHDFYNDTYLMDQNACSSPRICFWTGHCAQGRKRFWKALAAEAQKRYVIPASVCVDKYTRFCQDCIDRTDVIGETHFGNLLRIVSLRGVPEDIAKCEGFGGYFYECELDSFQSLTPLMDERIQTIVYWGISPDELCGELMRNHVRGVDRIVPPGSAMDIDTIWDGFDLVASMSRIISIQRR